MALVASDAAAGPALLQAALDPFLLFFTIAAGAMIGALVMVLRSPGDEREARDEESGPPADAAARRAGRPRS